MVETYEPKPFDLAEQIKQINEFKNLIESYTSNGLAKPLIFEKTIKEKTPTSDDTLSRLEALMNPPEQREVRNFEGAFFPLSLEENSDWLCILLDGTIIKVRPPPIDSDVMNLFKNTFCNAPEIKVSDMNLFMRDPRNYIVYGNIVYRNDIHIIDDETRKQIEKDIITARDIAIKRQNMINDQKQSAIGAFIKFFSDPQKKTDQANPQTE